MCRVTAMAFGMWGLQIHLNFMYGKNNKIFEELEINQSLICVIQEDINSIC